MINAYTLPITAVISWVRENVIWNTPIFGTIASGIRFGIKISEMTTPINNAFNTEPAAIPAIRPPFPFTFFTIRPTPSTRIALPIITHGMMAGIAAMIGLPEIKNAVTRVRTPGMIARPVPTLSTARISQALIMGPVI